MIAPRKDDLPLSPKDEFLEAMEGLAECFQHWDSIPVSVREWFLEQWEAMMRDEHFPKEIKEALANALKEGQAEGEA